MGAEVTYREYRNRYKPQTTDWLLGNVGDWQKLSLFVKFSVEIFFTDAESMEIINGGTGLKLNNGKNWSDYGFDLGDTINYEFDLVLASGTTHYTGTRVINVIQGDTITVALFSTSTSRFPYNNGNAEWRNARFWADKQPEGVHINYGHLQNADVDNANLSSFIDGSLTVLSAINTDTLAGYNPMDMLGQQSGMAIRSAEWIYLSKTGDNSYNYQFDIEFMISSFMEDLTNFSTNTPPSQVFDAASLTDNFEVIGYPDWNNPNTRIKSDKQKTKRLGNTGWFGENFNGLDNDFLVSGVSYFDVATNAPLSKLSYGSPVKVVATISGVQNLVDGLTECGIGFIWLPEEESYYKNKTTPFQQNLLVNTAGGFGTGSFPLSPLPSLVTFQGFTNTPNLRMDVDNVRFSQLGTSILFEAIWRPTASFKNFIDSLDVVDRNYALWVSVADRTLVTNFSNRVSLLLDYNKLELFIAPVGEWQPMTIEFYEHPNDGSVDIGQCANDFYVEDDVLAKVEFNVDILEDIPNAMKFVIEAERISDGMKYELQSYSVDLSGYPNNASGVPQWNYDQSRGFKYEIGNNKNWVKVVREPSTDSGSSYGYVAFYGFKIRWEDWISRTGVPNDFFDALERNNGFNNNWHHYLQQAGWKINFTVYTDVDVNGETVRYENERPFYFKGYDTELSVTSDWNFYRDSDNLLLNAGLDPLTGKPLGVILDPERVRLEVIYTRLSGNWADLLSVYGTICIEVDNGAGQFSFRQISSIWGREADNPLIPITGETKLKLTLVNPTTIKMECLVEPSLLEDASRYKVSSRLGCK